MSERQAKVAHLLQENVAKFVQQEANADPLITITRIDISPDLKRAIVFFTTLPDGKENEALIFLKRSGGDMRQYLKSHTKIKRIPHFDFMIDAGERHRQHIDDVFRQLESED